MMEFVEFQVDSPLYRQYFELRNDVLRRPLGLSLFDEDLSDEELSWHFALFEQRVVACVMLTPLDEMDVPTAKLRQMCVCPKMSRQGLGKQLVERVEVIARARGVRKVTMSARVSAESFYHKLGYETVGSSFLSVGIPHVTMQKLLQVMSPEQS
ncbi:acetyltransferase [Thalassoglobus neptunius]|uniref:Acetyltransferase n=1 Tax=Thalassoglobus neptunius TaxID=1938619 RepID=A0A5C5VYD0_9PLAN|nr:GNAT family N-acetyltransferase [Thalassoglobus neptunius]TWT43035.1 acetyltransferase [Thalassoglobus neptunius]